MRGTKNIPPVTLTLMDSGRIVIVGGGAAGFFAAIAGAEAGAKDITILERSPQFLSKVRISGGGRCNVTHACFDPREFATRYPRGQRALLGPFQRFQSRDTVEWFATHGVKLKTERDGRMFPESDRSQTIIDCLLNSARANGIRLETNCGVDTVSRTREGAFELQKTNGTIRCGTLLLAIGGCRTPSLGQLAVTLGHTLVSPVPSLFTFHVAAPWLHQLAGVSIETAEVTVPAMTLRERGPLLLTHTGLSGPAILRLSAWGARELHGANYRFTLGVDWLPLQSDAQIANALDSRRQTQPAKLVVNAPLASLPSRLWEQLVLQSGISPQTRCASLSRATQYGLIQQLKRMELPVTGKSLNKDEFVTCGGVKLGEVNLKTLESRICPGLFFAGEVLDIDGITGGFNFQAAWTTGWIAGRAMAARRT
jgi:predicted Rossmann fold flavoprotein